LKQERIKGENRMSLVEDAIDNLSEGHRLARGVDFPKVRGRNDCRLASGMETTLCALFCNYVKQHLDTKLEAGDGIPSPEYHEFFYFPSRTAEGEVGYDISIGRYQRQSRIRTMHKVLYASDYWCDKEWEWSVCYSVNRNGRSSGDYRHLISLLRSHRRHPLLHPYLVLHMCHCIHDYRRMGLPYKDWQIPSFDNLLRTVVVDLPEIFEGLGDWREALHRPNFRFTLTKNVVPREDHEPVGEYLSRIAEKELFEVRIEPGDIQHIGCVLTLDELCDRIERIAL
jgi:hypothetical protein